MLSDNNFELSIKQLQKLNNEVERYKANLKDFETDTLFFTQEDVRKITGWSKHTVETLFRNPDFPCTDYGKSKLVLKTAFIAFFSERRIKQDSDLWN